MRSTNDIFVNPRAIKIKIAEKLVEATEQVSGKRKLLGVKREQNLHNQYLNCKILHGGTLLHPWPNAFNMRKYLSEDYVIPSPKLNEHQKKRSSPEIEVFFFLTKLGEDQKKGLRRKLKCFFAKIGWRIRSFHLIIQRSNLDGETPKSRWGTLNLDGGR